MQVVRCAVPLMLHLKSVSNKEMHGYFTNENRYSKYVIIRSKKAFTYDQGSLSMSVTRWQYSLPFEVHLSLLPARHKEPNNISAVFITFAMKRSPRLCTGWFVVRRIRVEVLTTVGFIFCAYVLC